MTIIRQPEELHCGTRKVVAAIGMFDGVHRGHQRVLAQTVDAARRGGGIPVAVTFDRHPNSVVAPSRTPPLIYPIGQRLRVMESLGIETILLIHFDQAFSQQSGESFALSLVRGFSGGLEAVCIGQDFSFGYQRTGNVSLLRRLGRDHGFIVHEVPSLLSGEHIVSSTRIRQAIMSRDFDAVRTLLGRAYSIRGSVLHGEALGRKLGFPTANLDVAGLALPPAGVYAGIASAGEHRGKAVANLGVRPTVEETGKSVRFEVHLLDFEGDLYGRELEFEFVKQLRPEQKFASLDALRNQIADDVAWARNILD